MCWAEARTSARCMLFFLTQQRSRKTVPGRYLTPSVLRLEAAPAVRGLNIVCKTKHPTNPILLRWVCRFNRRYIIIIQMNSCTLCKANEIRTPSLNGRRRQTSSEASFFERSIFFLRNKIPGMGKGLTSPHMHIYWYGNV